MRFAGQTFSPQPGVGTDFLAYSPQEKEEDKMLLRSLQRGEIGSGPEIDKAIQDIINRISGVGQLKGV